MCCSWKTIADGCNLGCTKDKLKEEASNRNAKHYSAFVVMLWIMVNLNSFTTHSRFTDAAEILFTF